MNLEDAAQWQREALDEVFRAVAACLPGFLLKTLALWGDCSSFSGLHPKTLYYRKPTDRDV